MGGPDLGPPPGGHKRGARPPLKIDVKMKFITKSFRCNASFRSMFKSLIYKYTI